MEVTIELVVAAALLIGLTLFLELGYRFGRYAAKKHEAPSGGQVGAIQGAVLGMLALLLGFSFAGAASRFMERQDLIVQEANAIGTAYLRADLLDPPHAQRLRGALADYVRHRLDVAKHIAAGLRPEMLAEAATIQGRIWEAAREGVGAAPQATLAVLMPVNEVIDLHSARLFAGLKHLPGLVLTLLIVCSMLAIAAIGFGCGLSRRRSLPVTLPLVALIAASLWTTIDLDQPRSGLVRVSDAPLEALNLQSPPE